jgi:DNA-binding NarL/FixJ family response regulator/class 3 adenylate cyclase
MGSEVVTILFTDLVDATALSDRAGDEPAEAARREHFAALRGAVSAHAGREVSYGSGGLMVAFTSAVAAVRCAVDMQHATTGATGGLPIRIGLAAGECLPEGEDLYGTPVLVASRLCDAAGTGEILAADGVRQIAGPRVAALMQPAGTLRLSGLDERVTAAHVRWRPEPDHEPPEAEARPRDITVVVADDQRLLRAGFRVILDAEPDITVVGEAPDGRSAVGFLLKDTPSDRLLDAVRVAAAGDALLAPSITRRLIEQFTHAARPEPDAIPAELAALSARELDVLRLVALGLSNTEIASALVLGENTIKTHVAHVLSKLGLRDRVQAVVLAYQTGFAMPEGT